MLPHHQAHEQHAHDQAKVRVVKFKVEDLTMPLVEDEGTDPCERCVVTWTTKLSMDSRMPSEQLKGIQWYKHAVIREIQEGVKERSMMMRRNKEQPEVVEV